MITANTARAQSQGDYDLDHILMKIETRIDQESKKFNRSALIVEPPFNVWASMSKTDRESIPSVNTVNTVNTLLDSNGFNYDYITSPKGIKISW